ncbi:unnamed protein product [Durusdinium trenchii]|uniref:Pumilio homolog 5 (APUM-5) (AtPUM5) n=2 Tax=Durusdinium trenchii TaxID=1381693 RepID=A0ABP0PBN7_9DINO
MSLMPSEMMTSLNQMQVTCPQQPEQQVIVLVPVDQNYMTSIQNSGVPVNYVTWWPQSTQPNVHQQVASMPSLQVPCASALQATSVPPSSGQPTPRTALPSDDSDAEKIEKPRFTASTARRLRRKRAAERAKIAHAEGAPQLSLEQLRAKLREEPAVAVQSVKGNVWAWSRNETGCRLVQEALEMGTREAAELAAELQGHVLEAVTCPYANYVVQKVVLHLSTAASSFVAQELHGSAVRVAKHRFACRILCRLVELTKSSATSALIEELMLEFPDLCTHNFAHHVMESILENGEERHKKQIAKVLLTDPWKYATHKNSSYLVEKALSYCSQSEQEMLVAKLGHAQAILDLALTQFGCYVARALLRHWCVNAEVAMTLIAEHQRDLEATPHGQRFLVDVGLIQPCPVGQM